MTAGLGALTTTIVSTLLGAGAGVQVVPVRIDLGSLGGSRTEAIALNDGGLVVGCSNDHAYVWTESSGMIDLGTLGGSSCAAAVNEQGQVVGTAATTDGSHHAFSWTQSGGMIDLGTLGGPSSQAIAINERGQVVGTSDTADGSYHAFSWTQSDGMIDLGTLGGSSWAAAVNDRGQVVGTAVTVDGSDHAFSWTQSGGMIDLGTLGGSWSTATDVNESGQVVGYSSTATFYRAFLWTDAGGMFDLGALGGEGYYALLCSYASAINDSGQVAGESLHCLFDELGASFWWTQSKGMIDIYQGYSFVGSLNDRGQVAGLLSGADGWVHAFLWTEAGGIVDLGRVEVPFYWSTRLKLSNGGRVAGTIRPYFWQESAVLWKTDPDAEILLLRRTIVSMGLTFGTANSLTSKLDSARAAIAAGDAGTVCDYLAAVISEVSAQAGKKLTADQANHVIVPTTDIRTMLQCP